MSKLVAYVKSVELQANISFQILAGIGRRHDLTEGLQKLKCKTLIFVGERSPFHADSIHMNTMMNKNTSALVEVTRHHFHILEFSLW